MRVKKQNNFVVDAPGQAASRPSAFWLYVAMCVSLLLGSLGSAQAERSVTLAWNPSQGSEVSGYYLYVLEENSTTPIRITTANTNQATVPNLKEGLRYSFKVTAFNAAGESLPSNEALFVVPVPLSMVSTSPTNGLRRIEFQGAPGRSYELQASSDLQTWTTIWQSGPTTTYGPIQFEDPESATLTQRFYRLLVR